MATKESKVDEFVPVVKKVLTLPLLKLAIDCAEYIKITSPMFKGKDIMTEDEKKKEPVTLINCVNLKTGEECQMIVNQVFRSILDEEYENQTYVDRGFSVTKHAKKSGKDYHTFSVNEIEL